MESDKLKALVEKYWNADTSLEEEAQLRKYFAEESVVEEWKETATLFRYYDAKRQEGVADPTFDQQVLKKIKTKPAGNMRSLVYNMSRIAAGILVVVAIGYFVRQEAKKSSPAEVVDTYSDPQLAFEETKKALMILSKGFGKAQHEVGKMRVFNEAEQKVRGESEPEK
ncbi:MAG: hypothetical protein HC811_09070 [Flammeovirgaceae bacterium]|nr:hypothetical protein [Flammeovirgaceae bacterium]